MPVYTPRGLAIKHKSTGQEVLYWDATSLEGAVLAGVDLSHAWLAHANLLRANMVQTDLRHADLRHATLPQAVLDSALLVDANLRCANLKQANLCNADLSRANLQGAVLCGADLEGASLAGADLRWSNLSNANVSNADLTGADLEGALLQGIQHTHRTRWPDRLHLDELEGRNANSGKAVTFRVSKPRPGTLRLWTVQNLVVWKRLQMEGILYADPGCIRPEHLHAYEWMRDQMVRRIPGYGGGFPWWAWLERKPDLRCDAYLQIPGARLVRLELAVPRDAVLLSDNFSWHCALNRSFLPLTSDEDEVWAEELACHAIDPLDWPLPEPWQSQLNASWERVFDFDVLYGGSMWTAGGLIQGTFERLEMEQVIEVTEFMGR